MAPLGDRDRVGKVVPSSQGRTSMLGSHITDHQVRLYMLFRQKNALRAAAAKTGFSIATAYRFEADPRLPSSRKKPPGRRRPDPLAGIFDEEIVPLLEHTPGIRAVALFEELMRRHPELGPGVRRTLERRVRQWRAVHGPQQVGQRHAHGRRLRPPVGQLGRRDAQVDLPGAATSHQRTAGGFGGRSPPPVGPAGPEPPGG